jgi:hypothetical protein
MMAAMTTVKTSVWAPQLAVLCLCLLPTLALAQSSDQGIGGTGYYGAITGFGSIIVNGEHIQYSDQTPLTIDGVPMPVTALREGQIVRVVARGFVPTADRIDIEHEVVGKIDAVAGEPGTIRVLGQTVVLPEWYAMPGDVQRVAVTGWRRLDGVIEAEMVEPAISPMDQIAGTVTTLGDGRLQINGVKLLGMVTPVAAGTRIVVRGRRTAAGLQAASFATDTLLQKDKAVANWSVQSYFARKGNELVLSDGTAVHLGPTVPVNVGSGSGGALPEILDLSIEATGAIVVVDIKHAQSPVDPGTPQPAIKKDPEKDREKDREKDKEIVKEPEPPKDKGDGNGGTDGGHGGSGKRKNN